jgi:hypothetical protein
MNITTDLGSVPVYVDHCIPDTVTMKDGTEKSLGYHVNDAVFVSRNTYRAMEAGDLDVFLFGTYRIDLTPSDINVSLDHLPV